MYMFKVYIQKRYDSSLPVLHSFSAWTIPLSTIYCIFYSSGLEVYHNSCNMCTCIHLGGVQWLILGCSKLIEQVYHSSYRMWTRTHRRGTPQLIEEEQHKSVRKWTHFENQYLIFWSWFIWKKYVCLEFKSRF